MLFLGRCKRRCVRCIRRSRSLRVLCLHLLRQRRALCPVLFLGRCKRRCMRCLRRSRSLRVRCRRVFQCLRVLCLRRLRRSCAL